MCQTDLHGRDGYFASPYPAVYGHEGAGVVHAVGDAVRDFAPGDHVVMSYPWCGECANCRDGGTNHCLHGRKLKMGGTRARRLDAVVERRRAGLQRVLSAIFVRHFRAHASALGGEGAQGCAARPARPARLLGPDRRRRRAQCHAAQSRRGIAIFGVGAVGLSALMAAKIAGCDPIMAVDVHAHRLALAQRARRHPHDRLQELPRRRRPTFATSPAAACAMRRRLRRCRRYCAKPSSR